ncbi:MAG: YqaJ viral recombinase family protein [PVC group bacterium]|nr:YqaJ viral recombinase family protein [PVC group bacterium]
MMFLDIQQNDERWFEERLGKVTGSSMSKVMANAPKAFGNPAKEYAVKVALEQVTGKPVGNNYSNHHMERGHMEEPIARNLYEEMFFCEVTNGGFFNNGLTGCSPDGLVYHDGVIEIKSVIGHVQFATIKRQKFDPKYKWQLVFNLMESGREWIDYISYSADFPYGKQLFVYRSEINDFKDEFDMVNNRLHDFHKLVKTNKEMIL